MNKNLLLICSLVAMTAAQAQSLYFPPTVGKTWDTMSMETAKVCPDKVPELYSFLNRTNSKAFILLQDGKIVLEKYFGTFTQDSFWYWASAGKSLTATMIGIAKQKNLLKLDDTSSQYLGKGWTSLTPEQEAKITVWHQLTMTSGLDDGAGMADCTTPNCLTYKADPATRWAYHNGPYTLLDGVISGASGQTMNQFFQQNIATKTGINGLYIKSGFNNVFASTPRSFARFGLMTLAKGKWNGTAILDDTAYYRNMLSSSQTLNKSYGYLWWLNGKSSYMLPSSQFVVPGSISPSGPADAVAAMGKNGQICCVIPSQNRVWIRMGNDDNISLVPTIYYDSLWTKINELACNTSGTKNLSTGAYFFPNPANTAIEFSMPMNSIKIFNARGELMKLSYTQGHADVSHLLPGLYFIHAEAKNGQWLTQRMLVNR
jgi:CubicO group peptidase (beta-lactamase class C family)